MKALRPNYILSLTTIWTNNGPYDIFYMVIYVTLINLTMKMYLSTITEVPSFSLFMSFKIFNFEQIKINILWI